MQIKRECEKLQSVFKREKTVRNSPSNNRCDIHGHSLKQLNDSPYNNRCDIHGHSRHTTATALHYLLCDKSDKTENHQYRLEVFLASSTLYSTCKGPFKPMQHVDTSSSNIVGHNMLSPFKHHVGTYWAMLDRVGRCWMKFDFCQTFHPALVNIFLAAF